MASRATSGVWLGAVAAVLVMRLPMGFLLFLIVPWVILAVQTRFASSLRVTPLVAVEVCCMVASGMAVVLFHPGLLTDTGNSAFIMLAVIGVTLVVFRSAEPGRTARQVLSGLYWGAILVWLIGMGEIVTGVKLLPLLYPRANTLGAVSKNRWVVTATYPNYNDYGVVMAMLFTAVLARLWFNPRRGAIRLGRFRPGDVSGDDPHWRVARRPLWLHLCRHAVVCPQRSPSPYSRYRGACLRLGWSACHRAGYRAVDESLRPGSLHSGTWHYHGQRIVDDVV